MSALMREALWLRAAQGEHTISNPRQPGVGE
jgi:hypothetical protein